MLRFAFEREGGKGNWRWMELAMGLRRFLRIEYKEMRKLEVLFLAL